MEGTGNLSKEEIEKLPQLKFEEVEGFGSMQEVPFLGEPVIIPTDSGDLIDVRLLLRKGKFDEVIDLLPYLGKFPRQDFARYLAMAFLSQGEVLLKKSLMEELGIKKALEAQAFNSFDRAIKISPNPIDAYNSLGVVFGKNGLYDKALECFNWVLSVQPQDEIARHNLSETYSRMGRPPNS
jgi:tetratricopeptide (TPR) repeat protein